ncbi:MAG: 2-dehydro-3-deoxygalactonokinase [Sphingomonadaceae bacterium]
MTTDPHTILGIDWGTSNRRAYLLNLQGQLLAEHEDSQGMLAVGAPERFGAALAALLDTMGVGPDVPVLMSGMVGSASGWQEVPYLDCAVGLDQLPARAVPVADPAWAARCRIVPGYCFRNDAEVDVMRGEETQLLGAVALGHRDGWLVLPGTHCKWVLLRDGVIQRIATYMTGELFAMLSAGGTLAAIVKDGDSADAAGFTRGLTQAGQREPLSNSLFRVRAGVVAKAAPAAQAAATVSGLLIGAEFDAAARHLGQARGDAITVIGSPALATRYATAAAHFGLRCTVLDPHQVYCAALTQFLEPA